MAGAAAASRSRSPRPARLSRRRGQRSRWDRVLGRDNRTLGARRWDGPAFLPPGSPRPPPSRGRTLGSLTVSQERQQRGQEQQDCWAHGAACGRAPGRGRGRGTGDSERRGRRGQSRSQGEQRGCRRRHRRRQRLTESAPRPAPGVGARVRRAGLGAGAREERLTVKSQTKAQKTQRQEHRLSSHRQPWRKDCPSDVAHGPRLTESPTPSQACHPLPG